MVHVKDQLGHSSIQITGDLYGYFLPGAHRQAVERLAEATGRNLGATQTPRPAEDVREVVDFDGAGGGI